MTLERKNRKSSRMQSLFLAVFLGILVYYGIVIFHWQMVLGMITALPLSAVGVIYVASLILTPAITGKLCAKSRLLELGASEQESWKFVVRVSFYLLVVLSTIGGSIWFGVWLSKIFKSQYWQDSHWFWVSAIVLLIFGHTFSLMRSSGLISWKMLQDIKAIPIISPVFCFGAPALWSSNLAYASLSRSLISAYSTLSILAGVLFLVYLVAFGVLNHRFSEENKNEEPAILAPDGSRVSEVSRGEVIATNICFAIFGVGLYVFVVVLVDVLVHLSIA